MALVHCPECEKEVSSQAQSCPHCGFPLVRTIAVSPVATGAEKKRKKIIIAASAASVAVVACVFAVVLLVPYLVSLSVPSNEARVVACIDELLPQLASPNTFEFRDASFHADSVVDESNSTEDYVSYMDTEPACVLQYTAENDYGAVETQYAAFRWNQSSGSYELYCQANTLEYVDDSFRLETRISALLVGSYLWTDEIGDVSVTRVRNMLDER